MTKASTKSWQKWSNCHMNGNQAKCQEGTYLLKAISIWRKEYDTILYKTLFQQQSVYYSPMMSTLER